MPTLLERYTEACNFPGVLDEARVEACLESYLKALGITRRVVRIRAGWQLSDYPDLERQTSEILDDAVKRSPGLARDALDARDARAARAALDALDARAARDALDARLQPPDAGAVQRFAAWCVWRGGWYWGVSDLSWTATTHVGAVQLGHSNVMTWSEHVFEAFAAGCWILHFTGETLYWVAKPTVHVDRSEGRRRLHNETHAALECDLENVYFVRGVQVPAFVPVRPDWITLQHIDSERDAEVRRIMLEKFGVARYVKESGAKTVDECAADHPIIGLRTAKLYRTDLAGDEPVLMLDMLNSTPEPDGSVKRYMIRVDPKAYGGRAALECHAAMASTYRWPADGSFVFASPEDYRPEAES